MKHANHRRGAGKAATLRTLLRVCLLLLAGPAAALNPDILPSQHFVQTWGAKEGLPGNTIWSIHQTREGFLWLGSNSGLIVFDGNRFELLTRETVPELVSGDIRKIAESPEGAIWLATYGGGAVRYQNGQFSRFGTEQGLTSEVVNTVYVSHGGTVWAGTSRGACQLVRGRPRFECFGKDDGLIGERVVNVAEDGNGRVWFASLDNGVSMRRDDGSFVHYGVAAGLDQASVFMVTRDEQLGMFFGTYGGSYFQAGAQGIVPAQALAPLTGVEPIIALRDRDRQLWIGGTEGLWRAGQQPRLLLNADGGAQVFGLIEDSAGHLWAGSTSGLHSVRTPLFTHWGKPEGASDAAYVLSANSDGSVFIGTEKTGLIRLDPASKQPVQVIPDMYSTVTALTPDGPDRVWAGTYGRGLTLITENAPGRTLRQSDGLASDHVTALLKGQGGALWVGAIGGFSRVRGGAVDRTITQENGLPESMVRHISQEADGDLLLATDSGLAQLNPTTMEVIQVYNREDGLNSNVVATTLVDEQGTVWIGMRDGGLARLKGGVLTQFTAAQGIDLASVMTIVLDRHNHLWLAGRNGVARVRRQDLNDLADGRRQQVPTRTYTDRDGLRSMRIPGGYQSAGVLGSDGKVWLATDRGAVSVDPAQVSAETPVPNIYIRGLRVDGVRQPLRVTNEVPAGSRIVEIDYAAPALHDAARLRFSYRLGDTGPWMEAGDRRTAIFTSLPPRQQLFQVRAYFHGEPPPRSAPPVTTLTLQVAPLWYQTYLFYMLAAATALLVPWGAWTLARRSQAARQRQLEALVDERTEALSEALSTVERMSLTDSLTGIPNRRHLEERLESIWNAASRQGQSVAALVLDIDHFKQYNDTRGHQAGDECLQRVSAALAEHTRGSDFLARYGGEEFVVLMTGVDEQSGKIPARRLQASVRNLALPHPALGEDGIVTLSAGFALLPASEDGNPETLIRLADDALYEAKRAGRDRVVYHHEEIPAASQAVTA